MTFQTGAVYHTFDEIRGKLRGGEKHIQTSKNIFRVNLLANKVMLSNIDMSREGQECVILLFFLMDMYLFLIRISWTESQSPRRE